jgi:hypothetical protein
MARVLNSEQLKKDPTAHTSEVEIAETARRTLPLLGAQLGLEPAFGVATIDHEEPFQCSASAFEGIVESPS